MKRSLVQLALGGLCFGAALALDGDAVLVALGAAGAACAMVFG